MRLLIADDELIIREGLKSLDWGSIGICEVFSAANGIEARSLLEKNKIDIAILDIRMPGITGLELAQCIKEKGIDTTVVLLTGYAEFEYARKAISYGVAEYIMKPFRPREILSLLAKIKTDREKTWQKKEPEGTEELQIPESSDLSSQIRRHFSGVSLDSRKLIEELLEHYQQEISLDDLAVKYHFSSAYLSRKIRQETGYSYMELLKAIRLSYAAMHLQNGSKVSEACQLSGFLDQRYFSQVFKSAFACSPSEFRNSKIRMDSFEKVLGCVSNRK